MWIGFFCLTAFLDGFLFVFVLLCWSTKVYPLNSKEWSEICLWQLGTNNTYEHKPTLMSDRKWRALFLNGRLSNSTQHMKHIFTHPDRSFFAPSWRLFITCHQKEVPSSRALSVSLKRPSRHGRTLTLETSPQPRVFHQTVPSIPIPASRLLFDFEGRRRRRRPGNSLKARGWGTFRGPRLIFSGKQPLERPLMFHLAASKTQKATVRRSSTLNRTTPSTWYYVCP